MFFRGKNYESEFPKIVFLLHELHLSPFGSPHGFLVGSAAADVHIVDGEVVRVFDLPNRSVEQAEQDRVDIYNEYLTRGIEELRNRAEAARHDDTVDELWKYRRSEYQGIRNGVRRQGDSVNSNLPSNLMDEVEKVGEAYDIHSAVDEGWTKDRRRIDEG